MFLQTGEYVSASFASGIQSNKTGSWYSWSDYVVWYYEQYNCEMVFNSFYEDSVVVLTKSWLCIRSDNKQQVLTVEQILSWRLEIVNSLSGNAEVLTMLAQYTGIAQLLTGESFLLDHNELGYIINNELPKILQDEKTIIWIHSLVSVIWWWALIPLFFVGIFFIAIFLICIAIVWMFYALFVLAIASILKKPIQWFGQSCSITWLPLLLLSCVLDTGLMLPWWWDLLIFCALVFALMSIYFVDTKEPWVE